MLHLTQKEFTGKLVKLVCLLGVLSAFPLLVSAQQRDTVPVRKKNIFDRIFTKQKDTVKTTQPADNRRMPDDKIAVRFRYPDTMSIGAYTLIVEAYDPGGEWNANTSSWKHLNGTGHIKFICPGVIRYDPGWWRDAMIKPARYRVVSNFKLRTADDEIRERDLVEFGKQAKPGEVVELMMPHYNEKAVSISRYLKEIKVTPNKPEGLRVRFSDCTVSVESGTSTSGVVTGGDASYPTTPADPAVPVTLSISSGFRLRISAIIFSPGLDPLVNASLELPVSLTQNSECGQATLDLGEFRLSSGCEFYREYPNEIYGIWGVGNTTLAIQGKGFVADFSSAQSYPATGKPASWKGVVLLQGRSDGTPGTDVVSNIGYMQARYGFHNGLVESAGLTATFNLASEYQYGTSQPYGYDIKFNIGKINVTNSKVAGGELRAGRVALPVKGVQLANGSRVEIPELHLTILPNMDLRGLAQVDAATTIYWGDLTGAGGGDRKSFGASGIDRWVHLYFSAQPQWPFNPAPDGKTFLFAGMPTDALLDSFNVQGATFRTFDILVVHTRDQPGGNSLDPNQPKPALTDNKVYYRLSGKDDCWINVVTEGVHCHINGKMIQSPDIELGDKDQPLYAGGTSFKIKNTDKGSYSTILLQCVESAVLHCDYRSFIKIDSPVSNTFAFKEMVFTSTANNAGGDLQVGGDDSLAYWGLKVVPKPGFSSAGLVSVKTGQVIITAAGLAEYRHFSEPFWLTWGEMYPEGTMGRLFFDFNAAGQQFDQFNFIHDAVSLSAPVTGSMGFLRVGGTAFFPFFGGDYLHIKDKYVPGKPDAPFLKREIQLSSELLKGYKPTDFTIAGNWQDGLGVFNFTIKYADMTQDGFLGTGTSAVKYISGGNMKSTLDMNSRGTCIRIGTDLMDQRAVSLWPVANISKLTRIWGCACIKGDAIENLVIGGEVTDAANFGVTARGGAYLSAVLQITPSLTRFTLDGEAYMSIMASLDAMVNGHLQLTLNHAEGFVEGEVLGKVRVAQGVILVGSSLEAEGQLNWHLGIDFNELQGMVAMKIMGLGGAGGGGVGVGAGFYAGANAPKARAWVLLGKDPRYKLNMAPMPEKLTGVYGFLHVHKGVTIYLISGGYDLYIGSGAFLNTSTMTPYVVGNLGGRIYGEILGGFVSASASFNLQMLTGYPFGFQGTVGLEGCVVWVACKSVDLTIGLNTTEGFYIR